MKLEEITPLIITYNEAANIPRMLAALSWARQVLVVDSGSTDGTLEILAECPVVRVEQRHFDDFASQCNYGLRKIETPWVLSLDADYICPPEFEAELSALGGEANGFMASFVYCVYGRPLRACLYPPRIVLFRIEQGRYIADGHAHKLALTGNARQLKTRILHDDRKPLARWLTAQSRYADLEVAKLLSLTPDQLGWKDKLRKAVILAAPATLFYCICVKGLMLNGWPGIYYTLQRIYAEILLAIKLLDARLNGSANGKPQNPNSILLGNKERMDSIGQKR